MTDRASNDSTGGAVGIEADASPQHSAQQRFHDSDFRDKFLNVLARYMIVLLLLILILVYCILLPDTFATFSNFKSIVTTQAPLVIMSMGLMFPLAAGEFDFSVGAVIGFSPILLGVLVVNDHWSMAAALLVTILAGLAIGLINAFFIVGLRINSFITTLGTGTILAAVTLGMANSQVITGTSPFLNHVTNDQLFGLPYLVYYSWAVTLAVWYIFSHAPIGRYIYFTGEGREVARLAGLRVDAIKTGALVVGSLAATIAGILVFALIGSADPTSGASFLLPAYSAVFLGAATIVPGRVNAFGTLVAVYALVVTITGVELLGGAGWLEGVFNGAALVIAVTFGELVRRRRRHAV